MALLSASADGHAGALLPADHFAGFRPHPATTKTDTFTGRIDYIFLPRDAEVLSVLQLPAEGLLVMDMDI
jgi:hypothetical protein